MSGAVFPRIPGVFEHCEHDQHLYRGFEDFPSLVLSSAEAFQTVEHFASLQLFPVFFFGLGCTCYKIVVSIFQAKPQEHKGSATTTPAPAHFACHSKGETSCRSPQGTTGLWSSEGMSVRSEKRWRLSLIWMVRRVGDVDTSHHVCVMLLCGASLRRGCSEW
eukprot:4292158-Amphidinium_carterae.1